MCVLEGWGPFWRITLISLCLKMFENPLSQANVLANPLTPTFPLVPNRVPLLPEQHAEPPSVLPPRGAFMGQPELRSAPAQHDPDQREAAGAAGRAVLPILTGEHCVPLGYPSFSGLTDKRMARSDPPPRPLFQVYFRYPSPAASDGDQRSVSHQLVQCVYKKTSYPSPIQVFKIARLWQRIHETKSPHPNLLHSYTAPEGGGNQVLGPRRRVRPPFGLPGRPVRAEGRR